jgi:hypothetical protein
MRRQGPAGVADALVRARRPPLSPTPPRPAGRSTHPVGGVDGVLLDLLDLIEDGVALVPAPVAVGLAPGGGGAAGMGGGGGRDEDAPGARGLLECRAAGAFLGRKYWAGRVPARAAPDIRMPTAHMRGPLASPALITHPMNQGEPLSATIRPYLRVGRGRSAVALPRHTCACRLAGSAMESAAVVPAAALPCRAPPPRCILTFSSRCRPHGPQCPA